MAVDPLEIQLTPEQRSELARLADATGKPWAEVLKEALGSYRPLGTRNGNNQESDESLFDALSRDGLIGCIKDAPPDLSTNPKYMEAFGRDDPCRTD